MMLWWQDAVGLYRHHPSNGNQYPRKRSLIKSVTDDPTSCGTFDGSINIFASGGTAPYEYSVDNGMSYSPIATFDNLGANTYNVVIKDAVGCYDTTIVVLNDLNAPTIDDIESFNPSCGNSDGSINITVSGGNPNYEYSIDGGTTLTKVAMSLTIFQQVSILSMS